MMKKTSPREQVLAEAQKQIAEIRRRITQFEFVCSGTVLRRTKVCGKPTCKCATDPKARHGPYYEWTRREGQRLAHSVVSRQRAQALRRAIRNYREILRLLRRWEAQSIKAMKAMEE
jgi:hypothetical protein